jgi:hypothetical protein
MRQDYIIYQKGTTKVYIVKSLKRVWKNNKWHKVKLDRYLIRRDDDTCFGDYLGAITFNPRWRQYTVKFAVDTQWSFGCMTNICLFLADINGKWNKKIRSDKQ